MAYSYKSDYKFRLELRFKTVDDAIEWISSADEEVVAGEQRRHADDWVDMYFDSETDLAQFVKLAIEWETVEYFSVQK